MRVLGRAWRGYIVDASSGSERYETIWILKLLSGLESAMEVLSRTFVPDMLVLSLL